MKRSRKERLSRSRRLEERAGWPGFHWSRSGTIEFGGDGRFLQAVRPDDGGGHVEMRVSGIDAVVGAVGAVAEEGVFDDDGAFVSGDVPAAGADFSDIERKRPASSVARRV